ncbi:MurR/RpiR family transcriptional regulator [Enterococcus phoeniculicola]|uniref:MurR/RpiR family transcriptional regulator n=1 Tax=Enterococcus phoeniculicola TaxID=154621 RepID=UPI0024814351|nr:MurR/RpiR family transcriptional regulator [Enterococcus phoeniculicola]
MEQTFSSSEDEAVNYILSQGYNVHHLTLKQMSKESYTSSATFVRVAQRLGFTGWNEFKVNFLKEITYFDRQANMIDLNIPFDNTDSVLSIANKITELKKESLNDTIELLSYKTLQTAVDMLNDASEVKGFASNVNSLLAEEFQFKMNRIQKPVLLSSLEGEHIYDVLNMKEGAVAIVISYSGSSKKMDEIMQTLQSKKIPIVAITSLTENLLTRQADVVLHMATRESVYSKIGQYSTNTSIVHILDILYSAVFVKNFKKNMEHTIETSRIANYRRATAKPMEE